MTQEKASLVCPVVSLDDSRVAAYRDVRERDLRREGIFITEGALLAERLIASRFPIESFLVTTGHEDNILSLLREHGRTGTPIFVAEATLLREITGFDFHRGVLAVGQRLTFPTVADLTRKLLAKIEETAVVRLLACPGTETAENLGMILRSANAFGIDAILLPQDGADPLSRRCLRQSMGSALTVPIARTENFRDSLRELRQTHGFELVATVAAESSRGERVVSLPHFTVPRRSVVLVGNEFHGLSDDWLELCDHYVTIPIAPHCDSLNAAVATGIFLYQMSNPK